MVALSRVGIVVIGRNEGERLLDSLASAFRDVPPEKVVYVDSGSVDDSLGRARQLGAHTVALDPSKAFTAARARNAGAERLQALHTDLEYLQFVDGDCELVAGWIEIAVQFLGEHPEVAAVCGRRRELHPDSSLYNWLCDQEWPRPAGEAVACGGDVLIRVNALKETGGYRPTLPAGEEPELCLRFRERGWKIWRLDVEMTVHDARLTRFSQWWKRTVRGGRAYAEVYRLHRSSPLRIWRKETMRSISWAGILPLVVAIGGLLSSYSFGLLLLYPAQIIRISLRRGAGRIKSWEFAMFMMLAKFAEFQGMIRYYLLLLQKRISPH